MAKQQGPGRPAVHAKLPRELIARWRRGELNTEQLAALHGCSPTTARRLLKRVGAKRRKGVAMTATERRLRVVQEHEQGRSTAAIARALGVSRQYVSKALAAHTMAATGGKARSQARCAKCGRKMVGRTLRPPVYCPDCVPDADS